MKFRPCIDIHNGKVKQIVGSSLSDQGDKAKENFVASHDAAWFASLFQKDHLTGGHVIMLNHEGSDYYEATRREALSALRTYPGGLQIGGGINADNAGSYIETGAAQVIVTSYVFFDGKISIENLRKLDRAVGREHLVLDLSCSKKDGDFYIMTDRWQKYTETPLSKTLMEDLAQYCSEFLVHAIDAEGKERGINEELAELLSGFEDFPMTYAGGIHSLEDIELLKRIGKGNLDFTIGSALDLYGGPLSYRKIVDACKKV